ncbi:MAG: hypothetical protein HZB38_08260 [Planctomycetes bacterium]|nr:hypothetical protein [Planctomycetota bacterium]
MKKRDCLLTGIASLLMLACAAGCGGKYQITFEVGDVINAWGDDNTQEQLDVDIVCLSKQDTEKHPEIASRAVRSDDWFTMRQQDSAKIADIPASHIYAMRSGPAGSRDTLLGPPLLSAVNRRDKGRTTVVTVQHANPGDDNAAIVIFGRFNARTGMAKSDPVIIQPPPGAFAKPEIRIKVDRTSLSRVSP